MDCQFLHQIRTVGDARYKRGAGDSNTTKRQSIALRANEQGSKAKSEQRELPDNRAVIEIIAFAQPECENDQGQTGRPKPNRSIHQSLPPLRSQFFDRGEANAQDKRIEPRPGRVINPCLIFTERYAGILRRMLISEKSA